ncbi:hypothetical protein F2Q70_00008355 [Brassica cretica]|nr:hypothetical protein F2Q70_00008355 [Brassica cretica]
MVLNQMTCNVPNCWSLLKSNKSSIAGFNRRVLHEVINTASDGGIKPLHVAALKGHRDSAVTLEFGSFCCSGHCGKWNHNRSYRCGEYSSPLCFMWRKHAMLPDMNSFGICFYELLIDKGASLAAVRSLRRTTTKSSTKVPSTFLCLPLMSVVKIDHYNGAG